MLNYHDTYFTLSVSQPGPVVIALSQLDERYFRGLEGQYQFELALRLHKSGHEDYIVRSQAPYRMRRSINVELELEAGEYDVRVKIDAARDEDVLPVETVIRNSAKERRDKLTRIGLAYDLAHGKGRVVESSEEKAAREACEKRAKGKQRLELRKKIQESREEEYYLKRKQYEKGQERQRRARRKRKAKMAEREAKQRAAEEAKAKAAPVSVLKDASDAAQQTKPAEASGEEVPAAGREEQICPSLKPGTPEVKLEAIKGVKVPSAIGDTPDTAPQPDDAATRPLNSVLHAACESSGSDFFDTMSDLSELSDREFDIKIDFHLEQLARQPAPLPPPAATPGDDDDDEFERDPWNAVAVVGLRVYHQAPDAVHLAVVRPNPYASAEDADAADDEGGSKGLDVDDSAKDATLVGGVKDRKKSIMGTNSQRPA